jgi:hypothetical protein
LQVGDPGGEHRRVHPGAAEAQASAEALVVTVRPSFDAKTDIAGTCGTFQFDTRARVGRYRRRVNCQDYCELVDHRYFPSWDRVMAAVGALRQRREVTRDAAARSAVLRSERIEKRSEDSKRARAAFKTQPPTEAQKEFGHRSIAKAVAA